MLPIKKHFTTDFSINRLVYSDNKGNYEKIGESKGYFERLSMTEINQLSGVYTATHLLITYADNDIKIGDLIITDQTHFKVKGIRPLDYGVNVNHLEVHLEKVKDIEDESS